MLPEILQKDKGTRGPALVLKLLLEVTGKLAFVIIGQRLGPALRALGLHQLKGLDVK